ncbi:WD repeat-containing protein 74 [Grifola frondosa]|uniref:Ribosome biogenesis protein NSA1 n=1 Tax=Grifola frondosa TaxID=5627 RepID=A0A1C7MEC9_GRIFR|nr:WD repeat-containing protein 74 [Grifola frondosa]
MPRFFVGDELGAVKSIRYTPEENNKEWKVESNILVAGGSSGKTKAVQKLALQRDASSVTLLTAVRADGSSSSYRVKEDSSVDVLHEWTEPRLKSGQRYVGLAMSESGIYTCTSNGALRLTKLGADESASTSEAASLPMRLCDWRLSSDGNTFAYGGDEVELSVWDAEQAFTGTETSVPTIAESKKRKRVDQLIPGEIWRAKNVSNDNLNLRQPVHITALTYLETPTSTSHNHLVTGTQLGNVRRYDTRAARRPVSDWKGVGKIGGVSAIEKGLSEHEIFVADHGCNLFALDLRNGRTIYGYQGISGAVSSLAPAPSLLASASQDRFLRLHSTFPPLLKAGQQDKKGAILDKLYVKVIPTAVIWDCSPDIALEKTFSNDEEDEGAADDVWDVMENVHSDNEGDEDTKVRRNAKKSRAT